MAEQSNPFARMAPLTPEGMRAKREFQLVEQNKGLDYWAQGAGRHGLDLRNRLLAEGQGMTPEDQRAKASQEIMQRAQQNLAELVKSGEVDPMTAQEMVIQRTMSEFMSVGDYEAAQSFLPALNQVRTYRAELAKLNSEIQENQAQAYESTAGGQRDLVEAGATATKLPFETGKLEAETGAAVALAADRYAGARLKDRTDPNIRSGGKSSGGGLGTKEAEQIREAGVGTLNLIMSMRDLSLHMLNAPRGASTPAQAAAEGARWMSGLRNFFTNKGASVGGRENLSSDKADGIGGMSPKEIVARNHSKLRAAGLNAQRTLGIDVTTFESLVIDAAYALARANDPGGRLSNNDFDFSLKMLGAVQDEKSALAAFRALAERGYDKYKNRRRVYDPDLWEREFGDLDASVEADWKAFNEEWGGADIRKTPGPAKDPCPPARKKYGLC